MPGGSAARRRCSTTSCARIDDYERDARLPRGQGAELPVGAPALRHGVDPPRWRARPGQRSAGRHAQRREGLAVRADLARLLPPDPAPPPARRRALPSSRSTTRIHWEHGKHADELFAAWCEGRTGYPLVDAAMAQINQTGYMHNRLRMVVASFLTKDLGHRLAPRRSATSPTHLNDFDLAANNGGWQWAASTGCDAQPWFRIFNPVTQSREVRPAGALHPPLPAAAGRPARRADPCAVAGAAGRPGRRRRRARRATTRAPVVQHDEARAAHAGPIRRGEEEGLAD